MPRNKTLGVEGVRADGVSLPDVDTYYVSYSIDSGESRPLNRIVDATPGQASRVLDLLNKSTDEVEFTLMAESAMGIAERDLWLMLRESCEEGKLLEKFQHACEIVDSCPAPEQDEGESPVQPRYRPPQCPECGDVGKVDRTKKLESGKRQRYLTCSSGHTYQDIS